jgi:arylsulfatase A-like enzyme
VSPGESGFDEWLSAPNFFDNNPILSRNGKALQTTGESSMVTADAALEFIKKHKDSDQPFFTVVWFGSPHSPHEADSIDQQIYSSFDDKLKNFYGEITGMDRAFGKLRNSIREMGIAENTILWYCSDNGGLPGLGSTGGRGNKGQVYEGGLRVPAILEWPSKFKDHRVTAVPANTSDIFPTLLELIGEDVPHKMPVDGIGLKSIISNESITRSEPMGFWNKPAQGIRTPSREWMPKMLEDQKNGIIEKNDLYLRMNAGEISEQFPVNSFPGHSAWLDWPWKLHRIEKNNKVIFELYLLDRDPMETNDLIDNHIEQVTKMKSELQDWLVSVVHSLNGEDYK